MTIANASESVKAHVWLRWEAPEDADERTNAHAAVAAVFALAGTWLELAAVEARIGLYDRTIFTEGSIMPREPYHILRSSSNARVTPWYRSIESRIVTLDIEATTAWIASKLTEAHVDDARYEASLRELLVAGSRVRLPEGITGTTLSATCYAGEIAIPIDRGWVTAPTDPPGVPDPVAVRIANEDGVLSLTLELFWSPWEDELDRPSPLTDGLKRLAALGWTPDES
jgi:hypothetical protein